MRRRAARGELASVPVPHPRGVPAGRAVPTYLPGGWGTGAGAQGFASAAAWAGAQLGGAGSNSARARARGAGPAGAGQTHKAGLSEGRYGERRGAERLGMAQRLKGTVCRPCLLLTGVNPKGGRFQPFSCTF